RNNASSFVPGTGVAVAFTNLGPSELGVAVEFVVTTLGAGVTPPIEPGVSPAPPQETVPKTATTRAVVVATCRRQRPPCSPFITMATILKVRTTVENPRIRNLWITPKICGYNPWVM
ncbi:MAG: hypothetical protein E7G28_11500, partial [Cutibacterium avidum]|nr:hypothetical protein [Cutibacterium avidum]